MSMTQAQYKRACEQAHRDYRKAKKAAGQMSGEYHMALLRERNRKLLRLTRLYHGVPLPERNEE